MTDSPPPAVRQGPLPLVVGVTGHRDPRPEDLPALEGRVRRVFADLRKEFPATPLLLISSLAEGADRLVARVALDLGMHLVVPLPLPQGLYERDFATPESREEFRALLTRADQVIELPMVLGNTEELIAEDGEPRNRQYALAGAYVARHSQILLALWDGDPQTTTGGTAQVVQFQLDGVPEPYGPPTNPLDPVDSGPVYHIWTPRAGRPYQGRRPATVRRLFPTSHEKKRAAARAAYDRIYRHMDTFNRDALELDAALSDTRDRSRGSTLPEGTAKSLSPDLSQFLDCFAASDTLAVHFQKQALRTLLWLLFMAFLAAFFFNLSEPLGDELAARILYLVMLGAAYLLVAWAQRMDHESKYLDYRALAEGMRVQLFWRLAGLPDSVSDHYLRKQRSVLDWIRDAIRVWNMRTSPDPAGRLDVILDAWIASQQRWYEKAANRDRNRLQRWRRIGVGFFVVGVAWAWVKLFLGSTSQRLEELGLTGWVETSLLCVVVFISITPVVSALLYSYSQTRGVSEHSKQYLRMAQLFARAETRLRELLTAGRKQEARQLILDLGKEALLENSDWLQLHRERPMHVAR